MTRPRRSVLGLLPLPASALLAACVTTNVGERGFITDRLRESCGATSLGRSVSGAIAFEPGAYCVETWTAGAMGGATANAGDIPLDAIRYALRQFALIDERCPGFERMAQGVVEGLRRGGVAHAYSTCPRGRRVEFMRIEDGRELWVNVGLEERDYVWIPKAIRMDQ